MAKAWACCSLLVLVMLASELEAQDSSCLNQLVPCLEYINSSTIPPSSCCDPLRSLIKSDPQCLCSMLGSKSVTRQAGINMTQAQWLPSKCGQKVDPASCTGSHKSKAGVTNSAGKLSLVDAAVIPVFSVIIQILLASNSMTA